MRKSTAFLAIIACLYSPLRFGLIVLEEAHRADTEASNSTPLFKDAASGWLAKKIVAPGMYFRRPFSSKEKDFTPEFDTAPAPLFWTALKLPTFNSIHQFAPFFSLLRAPPFSL